jgi:hypothetical protein
MHCKYLTYRQKKYKKNKYCRLKRVWLPDCSNCNEKEYKQYKKLNPYSKKRTKLEKNRKSIFTKDLTRCIECGKAKKDLHEIFGGKNRMISIKYDLVIPLCRNCHQNTEVIKKWKVIGRKKFIELYGEDLFIKEFQTLEGYEEGEMYEVNSKDF